MKKSSKKTMSEEDLKSVSGGASSSSSRLLSPDIAKDSSGIIFLNTNEKLIK